MEARSQRCSAPWLLILALLWPLAACPPAAAATGEVKTARDTPVPDSEPRAELRLKVTLAAAQDCEERFDLQLYQDRSVDLILWDDSSGECEGRRVTIRYLSDKTTADKVLQSAQELALEASMVK